MTERGTTAATSVLVQLLGGFAVQIGERTIAPEAWRLSKARSLVKLLALAPGQRLARDRVLDALWPDFTPEAAQNNLYTTLAAARRTLEPDATVRLRDGILALESALPLTVDVAAFEEAARLALRSRDPADYTAALAHYGGELLPDDSYEDWAAARREPLRATYQQLLSALARLQQEQGQADDALATLQRLLADDPLHEEAHAALMRLYASQGQRALAIRQYQTLRAALETQLDAEPSSAVRRLYADIATGRAETERRATSAAATTERPRPAPHNLPAPLSSFVGREREVATVAGLLTEQTTAAPRPRLVTLLGIGGTGKTRLSLAIGREVLPAYADGAWFVDLAPLRDPTLVLTTTATVLGVREGGGQAPLAALVTALRERQLLVVLDNCEHLLPAVRELAEALLRNCPHLQILATSRERLQIPGEVAWAVPPLVPPAAPGHDDDPALLGQVPAVRLFLDRVRQHRPGLALTRENAPAVAAICRRLDGLPLALELAAARTAVLSLDQLATRLDNALGLLTTRERALPERQQTLRATLDWSYSLLTPGEQRLLAQLAVFDGGCTLAAIEAVTDADPLTLLDSLAALGDHSLIQRHDAAGEPRFRMLELVRDFATEQLVAGGEEATTRQWHADYFLRLAESGSQMEETARQRLLLPEEDNLRAALRWTITRPERQIALRLGNALFPFWTTRGAFREGRGWLDTLLDLTTDDAHEAAIHRPLRAQALFGATILAWQSGDPEGARHYGEQALALFRALDNQTAIARTLRLLANIGLITGQGDLVRHYLDEAEALLRALGDRRDLAMVLNSRGEMARHLDDDYGLAENLYREALALARTDGSESWVANLLGNLAFVVLRRGASNEALRLLHESLEIRLEMAHQRGIAIGLELCGAVAVTLGRFTQAARFYGAAERQRRAINSPRTSDPADDTEHLRYIALARAQADPDAWAADWATGAALPLDQICTEALAMSGTPLKPD